MSAVGVTKTVTAPSTVSGNTFSLTTSGATNVTLGSTVSYIKFVGSAGANVTGGSAASVITATAGKNAFTAGTNFMEVTGGKGADAYTFGAKSPFLDVEDFSAAKGDTLNVASSLKQGMYTITDNHNTALVFGTGAVIDLHGVTAAPTIHWTT
jgi:Ca2+-binding RTX toxin-like protein